MNAAQLFRVIRSAATVTGAREFTIFGPRTTTVPGT